MSLLVSSIRRTAGGCESLTLTDCIAFFTVCGGMSAFYTLCKPMGWTGGCVEQRHFPAAAAAAVSIIRLMWWLSLTERDPEAACHRKSDLDSLLGCTIITTPLDVLLMYCCGLGHWRREQSTYVSNRRMLNVIFHCQYALGRNPLQKNIQFWMKVAKYTLSRTWKCIIMIHVLILHLLKVFIECFCVCYLS